VLKNKRGSFLSGEHERGRAKRRKKKTRKGGISGERKREKQCRLLWKLNRNYSVHMCAQGGNAGGTRAGEEIIRHWSEQMRHEGGNPRDGSWVSETVEKIRTGKMRKFGVWFLIGGNKHRHARSSVQEKMRGGGGVRMRSPESSRRTERPSGGQLCKGRGAGGFPMKPMAAFRGGEGTNRNRRHEIRKVDGLSRGTRSHGKKAGNTFWRQHVTWKSEMGHVNLTRSCKLNTIKAGRWMKLNVHTR